MKMSHFCQRIKGRIFEESDAAVVLKNIDTLLPNTGLEVLRITWPKGDIQEYLIRIFTRILFITQNIKAKKYHGDWNYSYRVSKQARGDDVMWRYVFQSHQCGLRDRK